MLYLANPSTSAIRDRIADLSVAAIMTPRQGNELPIHVVIVRGLFQIRPLDTLGPVQVVVKPVGVVGDREEVHVSGVTGIIIGLIRCSGAI